MLRLFNPAEAMQLIDGTVNQIEALARRLAPPIPGFAQRLAQGIQRIQPNEEALPALPEEVRVRIAANNYDILRQVLLAERLDLAHRLLVLVAVGGNLEAVNQIFGQASPAQVESMVEANQYAALEGAAAAGRLQIVRRFFELASLNQKRVMLGIHHIHPNANHHRCHALKWAAIRGHIDIVTLFFAQASLLGPDQVEAMTGSPDYIDIFCTTAFHGQDDIVRLLLERASPAQVEAMIRYNHYEALECAVASCHIAMIDHLSAAAERAPHRDVLLQEIERLSARINRNEIHGMNIRAV